VDNQALKKYYKEVIKMIIPYKLQKLTLFIITGLFPVLVSTLLLFLGFPILGVFAGGIVTAVFLAMAGHWMSSTNAWVQAIQDSKILIIDVNSTGIAGFFVADIIENKLIGGIDIVMPNREKRSFTREMMQLLALPKRAIMKVITKEDGKEKVVFEIAREDFTQAKFSAGYLSLFFYNSQTGMFLSKPQISQTEKELMIDYITLNEWREVKELGKTMRDFMRFTMDQIMDRMTALFGNPLVKIILFGLIIVIIIAVLISVFPQAQAFLFPAQPASTGQVAEPLTKGITGGI
jgi:hypothetical protein